MVTIRSNVPEVAERWAKLTLKQVGDAAYRALTKTGLVGEARVKGIIEKEAYDKGDLLRSVTSVIHRSPELLRLVIGSAKEYALFVEQGRKPGKWPNLSALVGWTARKLRGKGVSTRVNVTFDQLKLLARSNGKPATEQQKAYRAHLAMIYLVGRKIASKGIRQKLIFKRIEDGLLAFFRNELHRELQSIR